MCSTVLLVLLKYFSVPLFVGLAIISLLTLWYQRSMVFRMSAVFELSFALAVLCLRVLPHETPLLESLVCPFLGLVFESRMGLVILAITTAGVVFGYVLSPAGAWIHDRLR